ncbi:MAG TPA: hypothetical protein PKH32_00980 [Verrucomicrobiota bacterium]|nr:hypothetical protein [Verrucomicrobiota bacterium]
MNAMTKGAKRFRAWAMVLGLALLAGCSTPRINWESRIGTYTYDQAVLELGPPENEAKLQDGTIVADWLWRRGYVHAYPAYYGAHPYWYADPVVYGYVQSPDRYLRLTFGPDRLLRDWKEFVR